MTCENPYKSTFRFQFVEQGKTPEGEDPDYDVWQAENADMEIDLFVRKERIFQIDITGYELEFEPHCEGPSDGECRCYYDPSDEWWGDDCPWGSMQEQSSSHAQYFTDLPFEDEISLDDIKRTPEEDVRPEFCAPASIVDALHFTWIIMDEAKGIRTILKGGQIERPVLLKYDEGD